ncbi:MAG: hypothetical protein NTX72_05165 [Candidatus Uhrbacteria bacterium]|nr:hypothetical protein [Candidatus Uhrbacteria bacterium]
MSTDLEQSILRTLCWFAVFDRPITGFEIWKWLIEPVRAYDLSEVYRVLEGSGWVKTRFLIDRGYYRLRDEHLGGVETRSQNYLDSVKKFRKLKRASQYLRLFSSAQSIAAVNSIAWMNTNEQSDIDLFVITKPKSIWSTRFWMVAPFIALGKRPGASNEDPFCFSFFATSSALAMNHLRLKEGDHYFAFWLKSLVPMVDHDGYLQKLQEENAWADHVLPNASSRRIHPHHASKQIPSIIPHTGFLESFYRSVSHKRFPLAIRNLANKDSRVVISDDMLKFHETDRRAEFEHSYRERIKQTLI